MLTLSALAPTSGSLSTNTALWARPCPPSIDQMVSVRPSMALAAWLPPLAKLSNALAKWMAAPSALAVSSLRPKSPGAPS
jgi:hypothetical protein